MFSYSDNIKIIKRFCPKQCENGAAVGVYALLDSVQLLATRVIRALLLGLGRLQVRLPYLLNSEPFFLFSTYLY